MSNSTDSPKHQPGGSFRARLVVVLLAAVVLPVGVSLLYRYSPSEYTFLPCMFNRLTDALFGPPGLHCPGCGATRCAHALLHGDFEQAFAWNPLFVILLPVVGYVVGREAYGLWIGRNAPGYRFPAWTTKLLFWTMLAYWIARNIPVEPFTLLAPHALDGRG